MLSTPEGAGSVLSAVELRRQNTLVEVYSHQQMLGQARMAVYEITDLSSPVGQQEQTSSFTDCLESFELLLEHSEGWRRLFPRLPEHENDGEGKQHSQVALSALRAKWALRELLAGGLVEPVLAGQPKALEDLKIAFRRLAVLQQESPELFVRESDADEIPPTPPQQPTPPPPETTHQAQPERPEPTLDTDLARALQRPHAIAGESPFFAAALEKLEISDQHILWRLCHSPEPLFRRRYESKGLPSRLPPLSQKAAEAVLAKVIENGDLLAVLDYKNAHADRYNRARNGREKPR